MDTKICTKCGLEKAKGGFQKTKGRRDGYSTICKNCTNIKIRTRREADSGFRERERQRFKARYAAGLDKHSRAKYQASDKYQKVADKAKKTWAKRNPEHLRKKDVKHRKNLNDCYVKQKLRRRGLTSEMIDNHPEIIEVQRLIIKTQRLWKTSPTSERA